MDCLIQGKEIKTMKIYENEKYLIVDTQSDTLFNPVFIFFKEKNTVTNVSHKALEDNICYPDERSWQYETAKLYLDNFKRKYFIYYETVDNGPTGEPEKHPGFCGPYNKDEADNKYTLMTMESFFTGSPNYQVCYVVTEEEKLKMEK